MKIALATPNFDDDDGLAAFQAMFNRPAYDPAAALEKAKAIFPATFDPDSHWLSLALICANSGLEWVFRYMDWHKRQLDYDQIRLGMLSSGEHVLAVFALHLLNDVHKLPNDGLTNLRLLDDWHFELVLHAIRIHSRGVVR